MIGFGNHGLYCVFLGLSRGDANRNFSQLVISQTLSSYQTQTKFCSPSSNPDKACKRGKMRQWNVAKSECFAKEGALNLRAQFLRCEEQFHEIASAEKKCHCCCRKMKLIPQEHAVKAICVLLPEQGGTQDTAFNFSGFRSRNFA